MTHSFINKNMPNFQQREHNSNCLCQQQKYKRTWQTPHGDKCNTSRQEECWKRKGCSCFCREKQSSFAWKTAMRQSTVTQSNGAPSGNLPLIRTALHWHNTSGWGTGKKQMCVRNKVHLEGKDELKQRRGNLLGQPPIWLPHTLMCVVEFLYIKSG